MEGMGDPPGGDDAAIEPSLPVIDAEDEDDARSVLRRDLCKLLVTDSVAVLPSKTCYDVQNLNQLVWSLSYLYDRLKKNGENRTFYKWCVFARELTMTTSGIPSDENLMDYIFSFRSPSHPSWALDESVASTVAILSFFFVFVECGRVKTIVTELGDWASTMCDLAIEGSGSSNLDLDGEVTVFKGIVSGLQQLLHSTNLHAFKAWERQWNRMHDLGILAMKWNAGQDSQDSHDEPVILMKDLVLFGLHANRCRKSSGKPVWPISTPSGKFLLQVRRALIKFLSTQIDEYVRCRYGNQHDTDRLAPSRRFKGSKQGRSSMSVDAIWEVLQSREDTKMSGRDTLKVCKSKKLSQACGAVASAQDHWVRKLATMYDDKVMFSLAGACHINMVCDGSTHSGKDMLVSILWSGENNTAIFCNVQQLLPGKVIIPNELDLTPLVEMLAKETRHVNHGTKKQLFYHE